MRVESIKCDVCGKIKGEANKWIEIIVGYDPPFLSVGFPEQNLPAGVRLTGQYMDICSDTCLQVELGKALTKIRDTL